jgi:hypothetical protein
VTIFTTFARPPRPRICPDDDGGAAAPLETPRRRPPPSQGMVDVGEHHQQPPSRCPHESMDVRGSRTAAPETNSTCRNRRGRETPAAAIPAGHLGCAGDPLQRWRGRGRGGRQLGLGFARSHPRDNARPDSFLGPQLSLSDPARFVHFSIGFRLSS